MSHLVLLVGADWEYSYDPCSELGPQHWGDLHEEWETCKTGEQQSPISIKPSNIIVNPSLGSLRTNYDPRPAFLQNKGHEILVIEKQSPECPHVLALTVLNPTFSVMLHACQVNWRWSPGDLVIGEKTFHLRQCHWHSPSEHELYGKRFELQSLLLLVDPAIGKLNS